MFLDHHLTASGTPRHQRGRRRSRRPRRWSTLLRCEPLEQRTVLAAVLATVPSQGGPQVDPATVTLSADVKGAEGDPLPTDYSFSFHTLPEFFQWNAAAVQGGGLPIQRDASHANTVRNLSPLAYYRLDETSGDIAVNVRGVAPDGQYMGEPTLGANGVFGESGNAAVIFDGVDDFVELPDDGSLDIRRNISLSFWMKVERFTNSWMPLVFKGNGNDPSQVCERYARRLGQRPDNGHGEP